MPVFALLILMSDNTLRGSCKNIAKKYLLFNLINILLPFIEVSDSKIKVKAKLFLKCPLTSIQLNNQGQAKFITILIR